jgi:hypothetical protein
MPGGVPGSVPGDGIRGVIARLDQIVDDARRTKSRVGYFAALYRRVTREVLYRLPSFADPARMERLDVEFARRYLDAHDAFRAGQPVSRAWRVAFEAAERADLIAIQHLVAGINAHINLDLGVAAARVAPGPLLPPLHGDFERINQLLAGLMPRVQADLADVSPVIGRLDAVFGRLDSAVANFSLVAARDFAWTVALSLAWTPPALQEHQIRVYDRTAAHVGALGVDPPPHVARVFAEIRARESTSVVEILDALAE